MALISYVITVLFFSNFLSFLEIRKILIINTYQKITELYKKISQVTTEKIKINEHIF